MRSYAFAVGIALASVAHADDAFRVDPEAGNSNFSAVFDAAVGERINAVSSTVGCELTYSPLTLTVKGTCSVPLESIRVDNDDTKSEHFRQWATNKKMEPAQCRFDATLDGVRLQGPLEAKKPIAVSGDVPFTLCGKARMDGGKEKVTGTALLLPAGEGRSVDTVRVRAHIERFDREAYRIGPKFTEGWLSRVQQLAPVVAREGTIDLSLFAKKTASKSQP
jgi:hypothetical protein